MDSKIQDLLESELKDREYPDFETGDTISVFTREEIGGQMRDRKFEGVCISRDGKGPDQTFKVRKDSFGVGVERIFPLYSPMIKDIKVERKGKVRQAKLNYLENRSQKDARIEEKRVDLDEVNRVETGDASGDTAEEPADESEDVEESAEETDTPEDEAEQPEDTDEDAEESEEAESDAGSAEAEVESDSGDSDETPGETNDDDAGESADEQAETDDDSPNEEKEEVGESV